MTRPLSQGKHGIRPENVIWIIGTGRTGSSWLMGMLGSLDGYAYWSEPFIGELFGGFHGDARQDQLDSDEFILNDRFKENWLDSVREFVINSAAIRHPELTDEQFLVIKESTASRGAQVLTDAFPTSRLILLVRDPRDVVASRLDGAKSGNWMLRFVANVEHAARVAELAEHQQDMFVEQAAADIMRDMVGAKTAYDMHEGPKVLVRYEDLRADPLKTLHRVQRALSLPVDQGQLREVIEQHSWENIPPGEKGAGKFFRKGAVGAWTQDLTAEQADAIRALTTSIFGAWYFNAQLPNPDGT